MAEVLCAEPVHVAVCDVEVLDVGVRLENWHQNHKVLATDIVLADVEVSDAVRVLEGEGEVLEAEAVVKQFVEGGLLQFVAVTKFYLEHAPLVHVCKTDHVLRKIQSS